MSQLEGRVPVGFRFHPTDEELVGYYLPKKVNAKEIDLDLIRELDLYKLEPWDLQESVHSLELCKIQGASSASAAAASSSSSVVSLTDPCSIAKPSDCYFFSRKDRKYPTGNRANRATAQGFWKATGRDKPISTKLHARLIGMRKTLVFYQGRAPHGLKTEWIMHEFRLEGGPGKPPHEDGGWVVCRVFQKNKNLKLNHQEHHQLRLLPDSSDSPEMLSAGCHPYSDQQHHLHYSNSTFYNNKSNNCNYNYSSSSPSIKQEMIYPNGYPCHYLLHHQQYYGGCGGSSFSSAAIPNSMLSSPTSFGAGPSSFRRPPGQESQADFNTNRDFHIPESREFHNEAATTTSESDVGDGGEEAALEGIVDWGAILQESAKPVVPAGAANVIANPVAEFPRCTPAMVAMSAGSTDLGAAEPRQQMQRPSSDVLSMELWSCNPVAQPQ